MMSEKETRERELIAYQDPDHPSYHGKKTVKCLGCGEKCSKSAWGNWCYKCNIGRLDRISASMDAFEQRVKFDQAVRDAVGLNERVIGNLIQERNGILRAAGGHITATKEQMEKQASHESCQYHDDGSKTFRISL